MKLYKLGILYPVISFWRFRKLVIPVNRRVGSAIKRRTAVGLLTFMIVCASVMLDCQISHLPGDAGRSHDASDEVGQTAILAKKERNRGHVDEEPKPR